MVLEQEVQGQQQAAQVLTALPAASVRLSLEWVVAVVVQVQLTLQILEDLVAAVLVLVLLDQLRQLVVQEPQAKVIQAGVGTKAQHKIKGQVLAVVVPVRQAQMLHLALLVKVVTGSRFGVGVLLAAVAGRHNPAVTAWAEMAAVMAAARAPLATLQPTRVRAAAARQIVTWAAQEHPAL